MPTEKAPASKQPGKQLSYEQARDQLTELVKRLESGGLTLEQSLELWERGEQLAAICEDWLEGARARLAAIAEPAAAKSASGSDSTGRPGPGPDTNHGQPF